MRISLEALPNGSDTLFSGRTDISGRRFSIGRATENDWVISDSQRAVSKRHCVIEQVSDGYRIVDTSTNGTSVNGRPVDRNNGNLLRDGDEIAIGSYRFKARISVAAHGSGKDLADPSQPKITAILHDVAPSGITASGSLPGIQEPLPSMPLSKPSAKPMIDIGWDGPPSQGGDVIKPADIIHPRNHELINRSEQIPTASLRIDLPRPKQILPDDWNAPQDEAATSAATSKPTPVEAIPQAANAPQSPPIEGVDRANLHIIPVENIDVGGPPVSIPAAKPVQHSAPPSPQAIPSAARGLDVGHASDLFQAFCDGAGLATIPDGPQDSLKFFHNVGRALAIALTGLQALQVARIKSAAVLETGESEPSSTPWIFSLSGENQSNLLSSVISFLAEADPRDLEMMRADFQDVSRTSSQLSAGILAFVERLQADLALSTLEQRVGSSARMLPALRKAALWDKLVEHSGLFNSSNGKVTNVNLLQRLQRELKQALAE